MDKEFTLSGRALLKTVASFWRDHRYALLISLLFIFHGVNNYRWLKMNTLPPIDDLGFHLSAALDCQVMLRHFSPHSLADLWNYTVAGFYPPLFHFCMALFNAMLGASPLSSIMANMVFLALLFAALYGIGRKMGNPDIGLLGSFIVTMYPYVFSLTRQPFPDFALLAAVTTSFGLLLYTDGFTNRTISVLFGISLGIGMLVKQVFAPFIFGPSCVALGYLLFAKGPSTRTARINALYALVLGTGISLSWYLPKIGVILPRYLEAAYGGKSVVETLSPALFSLRSMRFYLVTILYHQIFIFFTALFFAGGILFFLRGKDTWLKIMLISPLVGAYLLFFFISTKEHKTTVPYLVFFALITSTGLLAVRITALRRVIIGLVIAIGILQYFDVSYWNGALTVRPLRQFLQVPLPAPLSVTESFTPTGGNWKVNEVAEELDAVVARIGMRRGEPVYFALSDKFYYGFRSDNYYVTNLWPVAYFYWLKKNGEHPRVEPVSLRTGDWKDGIEMLILSEELAHSRCPEDERRNYRLVKQLSMPDNSPVFLYEREHDG